MAADLPDMGHKDSNTMARVLVTYMACPRAVLSRIREDFDRPPELRTIEQYRAEYLASRDRPQRPAFKPHDGHHPCEASERAAIANRRFVARLRDAYPQRFVV